MKPGVKKDKDKERGGRLDPEGAIRVLFALLPHGGSVERAPQGFGLKARGGQTFRTFLQRQHNRGAVEVREDGTFIWLRNPNTGERLDTLSPEDAAASAERSVKALVYTGRMPALERARVFFLELRGEDFAITRRDAQAGFTSPLSARRFVQEELCQRHGVIRRVGRRRGGAVAYAWTSKAFELWGHLLTEGAATEARLDARVVEEAIERVLATVAPFRLGDRLDILQRSLDRVRGEFGAEEEPG